MLDQIRQNSLVAVSDRQTHAAARRAAWPIATASHPRARGGSPGITDNSLSAQASASPPGESFWAQGEVQPADLTLVFMRNRKFEKGLACGRCTLALSAMPLAGRAFAS